MQNANELHNLIATALTGLVKQIKAIRYYPAKHPALQAGAEETLRGFQPIFTNTSNLSLTIRKEGFLFGDLPVAKSNQVLVQLANFCFARRIQHLTFLSELNSGDLHCFVHYLLLEPQDILKAGGIQSILEKARVTTIWANIRELDDILERKEELEELPPEPDFDPESVLSEADDAAGEQEQAEAQNLEKLLQQMEQEQDDARYQHGLQELIPLLRLQMDEEKRVLVLRALLLLCRCATGKQYSEERKGQSMQALNQLANDEMVNFLVAYLCAEGTDQNTSKTLIQILAFLRGKVAKRLMNMLADEEAAPKRKLLSDILVRIGIAALPVLQEYLDDDRWFVVRNAIGIMGDIRSQESLAHLPPLLQHDDIRVRRETIRALTKIGGQRAINLLLQTSMASDQELRRQAILSLGAIRAAGAVPTLLSLLQRSDWSQRSIDLKKDAIRALSEIRDTEAVPTLVNIIKKKSFLHRKLNDELRIAATAALGDLADESTRDILEKTTCDRTAAVARTAAQALKQLNKANT